MSTAARAENPRKPGRERIARTPSATPINRTRVGYVAIGRNEGERLRACLSSLRRDPSAIIVYVDSGSTDSSLEAAREFGAQSVELDTNIPFTAARARNAGASRLLELAAPDFIQFVDGDCTLDADWMRRATGLLDARKDVAVVCGRRRERFPDASVYNRLCDIEWASPIGDALSCGGDALMRAAAFRRGRALRRKPDRRRGAGTLRKAARERLEDPPDRC
ncbi:MAG: glycosyltransferase family A protein [Parvularculaceae bacterium]